ncbi:DNA/RNA non-specific endonuclease [Lactobacillus sp.]|uniref:DNA/RNA non-specific endonuclease n=1 Tax=Lactobacillus sp. TaxID=1591 RepID=UPI0019CE456A|nr:DNA/RNA non-specific endonuclease [Lactobacillus sp.]MBD5430701.1 DNA/RNA non-specific endonuclease [Lactobacillus sp.]
MAKRNSRKSKKNQQIISWIVIFIAVIVAVYNWSRPSNSNSNSTQNIVNKANTADTSYGGLSKTDYQKLAKLDFKSGSKAYVYVNNDHSTLIKNAWKVNKVIYSNLDSLNRTSSSNTAFLEKRNVADQSLRVRQYIDPTGWHSNKRNGVQIYNRGHLIAYSVSAGIDQDGNYNPGNKSGDQNNPKNLFTQSAFTNQKIQTIFESKVRKALRQGDKVIYQATPIFRGNELMARGINLQAISVEGDLDFNVYIFNVQPDYVFNYANGRAKVDHNMRVTE